MSTASSHPRASLSSTPDSSRTGSPAPQPSRARANRSALRDYYGLKSTPKADVSSQPSPQLLADDSHTGIKHSELDDEGFDAEAYVRKVLATKHLEEALKIEGDLIGEIKSLDGEKKALVYDNYSKLITATDTIRRMRENMGPLMPADGSLEGDVARIAEMAEGLAMKPHQKIVDEKKERDDDESETTRIKRKREAETVRWVLKAPQRLERRMADGKHEEAEEDWREVKELLDRWEGVKGVEEVKEGCQKAMQKTSMVS